MANNYTEIMKLVNQGNKMGLSNTITRDNGIPLDLSSVQETYEAAVIYAATKSIAYVGQPVAVGNKLYIISETAAETKFTAEDGTEYDNYLVEVGSKTEGDGVTIDLEAGVLKLHGFEDALAGYIPQKKAVYKEGSDTEIDHYEIEWVAISAIVEGDGNKVTTLTSEDGSVTIEKKTDTDASLVYDLKVTLPDVPEYSVTVDEREDDATSTTYHLTKDSTNEGIAIVVPDAYNDAALAGRVKDVEDNKANAADVYTKGEVDTAIDDAVKSILGEGVDEAYNTLKEIQDILEGTSGETIDGLIESVDANKQAIETLNGTAQTEGSVAKAVADAEVRIADIYATKQELTDHSNTMDGKLAGYYTKTETDGLLDSKVDDVDLENYYTKAETVAKTEVYTKGQIDQMLEDIEGGSTESAASVKRSLDKYIQDTDTEVYGADLVAEWTAEDGTYTPNYLSSTSRIDTALANAATAQTQADKGVADAKAASDAVSALANGAVATNTGDISAIKGRLETVETAKGNHETRLGVVEGKVTSLEGEDVKINATLGTITGQITTLEGEDSRLAGLISANTTEIGKKAAQTDVDAINTKIGTVAEDKTLVQMIADAQSAATYDDTKVKADIAANTSAIEAIYKAGSGVEGEDGYVAPTGVLAEEIVRAKAAEKANEDAIVALIGEDTNKTIRSIAAEEVAAIVDSAPEDFDTLKEIAEYIASDKTNAANINNKLAAHDTILAGFGTEEGQVATVVAAIATAKQEAIDAAAENAKQYEYVLPAATVEALGGIKSAADVEGAVAVNAVYVDATSNIGSVKAVSTDVLVQGSQELRLYGGSAQA